MTTEILDAVFKDARVRKSIEPALLFSTISSAIRKAADSETTDDEALSISARLSFLAKSGSDGLSESADTIAVEADLFDAVLADGEGFDPVSIPMSEMVTKLAKRLSTGEKTEKKTEKKTEPQESVQWRENFLSDAPKEDDDNDDW